MGANLVYLDRPNTTKQTEEGQGTNYHWAVSQMQGWRINMVLIPNLKYIGRCSYLQPSVRPRWVSLWCIWWARRNRSSHVCFQAFLTWTADKPELPEGLLWISLARNFPQTGWTFRQYGWKEGITANYQGIPLTTEPSWESSNNLWSRSQ